MPGKKTYRDWMKLALAEAAKSGVDVPVGALVVKDGEAIGRGHNRRESDKDPTAHAEMLAIRQAAWHLDSWRLSGCILIATLEPCPMCAEAAIQARVAAVVFGAYDRRGGACGSAFNLFTKGRICPIPEIIAGIEEEECQNILSSFFKTARQGD